MQKLKAKKEVIEQITSKLEDTQNKENEGNLEKFSSIFDNSSKLPASKNIFQRGDFDEYKISDEELKEHEKDIEKSYIHREFVRGNGKRKSYWRTRIYDGIEGKNNNFIGKEKLECEFDLKTYSKLSAKKIKSIKPCSDFEFAMYCNNMLKGDHKGVPGLIKINGLKGKLQHKLHLDNTSCFIVHDKMFHVSPLRKKSYGQALRPDEYKLIPKYIRDADFVLYDVDNKSFLVLAKDVQDNTKLNFIAFNKDKKGNYFATVGKRPKDSFYGDKYKIVGEGFEPSIPNLLKSQPNSILSVSPTNNFIIPNSQNLSSNINKSLTYSGHKLQGRTKLYGMDISIENKKGSYRSGIDSDGHKWRTFMNYDYGYIRGTEGVDGDHVDCYIGPDKKASKVYIIHQNNPVTHKYDEDKCMLCFSSTEEAKKAYLKQYDRPGFFGSMETMSIEQFKSYVFSHLGKRIHKSFEIQVTDITEANKAQKVDQVEKALYAIAENKPFIINHIPADTSRKLDNIILRFNNFDKSKIEKAVHKMAFTLDTTVKTTKGEPFLYVSQEELTNNMVAEISEASKKLYNFVISYLGLPEVTIISKADLSYNGKIIYDPATGKPMDKAQWNKFVENLEKFLNRNYSGVGKKIVLSAETLGRILNKLSKTNSLEAIKKTQLSEIKYGNRTFEWISETVQNMKNTFGESFPREREARLQVAIDSAAMRVTKVTDNLRDTIQQTIIDGIKNMDSKAKVSQSLFENCVGFNRDLQRIADTEIQNNMNNAYVNEEVYNSRPGEKIYFQRYEILDGITCNRCRKAYNKVALFSDVGLPDENIIDVNADIAIWEGKVTGNYPMGVFHPYCRGGWIRYYPKNKYAELMQQKIKEMKEKK